MGERGEMRQEKMLSNANSFLELDLQNYIII